VLVVRILFWTWFAISVSILIFRGVRRVLGRGDRLKTSGVGVTSGPSAPPAGQPEPTPPPVAPVGEPSPTTAPANAATRPSAVAASRPGPHATIASLASGIRMPCDLVPMLDAIPRPGTIDSVTFATTGHPPTAVGEAVSAELERLGFRVHPLADGDLLAVRGEAELKAGLIPNAKNVARGGIPAFPSARPDTLVVELWRD
jgi:hypothetical protein